MLLDYKTSDFLGGSSEFSCGATVRLTFIGFEENSTTAVGWIAMTFGANISVQL